MIVVSYSKKLTQRESPYQHLCTVFREVSYVSIINYIISAALRQTVGLLRLRNAHEMDTLRDTEASAPPCESM